jgi:hypothetical protein
MLIIGFMMAICSITGLPWCVAATVLCLGHVDSLKMETEASAPGEKPTFLGVRFDFVIIDAKGGRRRHLMYPLKRFRNILS